MNYDCQKGLISVLMGVYNCEKYVGESIESIQKQTYPLWELIICDDGSVDNTLQIVRSYAKEDSRIKVIRNKRNRGLNYTLNHCLKYAKGEFVARQDGDDVSIPTRFEKQIVQLIKNPDYQIVSSPMIFFDENGDWGSGEKPKYPRPEDVVSGNPICHAPVMMYKECMTSVQGYTVDKHMLRVEDVNLWIKLYEAGYRCCNLDEPLYKMRNDQNAFNRRKYKYRINSTYVRLLGCKSLKLGWKYYIKAFRPMVIGLAPARLRRLIKRQQQKQGGVKQLFSAKNTFTHVPSDDLLHIMTFKERMELQKTLLEMYQDITAVCNKYSITPFLIGGSALGAVRHHGFIPWDDDLDIGMLRADYERFKHVFQEELSAKYILNAPNYSKNPKARFPKIIKKGTKLRGLIDVHDDELNGVFLDIFIVENVPKWRLYRQLKGAYCNALEFISGQVFLYENLTSKTAEFYKRSGEGLFHLRMLIGRIFSFHSASRWFHIVDKAVRYRHHTGYLGIPTGRKHYLGEVFSEDIFCPPVYVDFCSMKVPVFHNQDTYLKNLYGDYMKIPDEKDREKHYIVELQL